MKTTALIPCIIMMLSILPASSAYSQLHEYFTINQFHANVVLKSNDLLICTDSGYTYQWYYNDYPIEGETKQFLLTDILDHDAGFYRVEIQVSPSCRYMGAPYFFSNKNAFLNNESGQRLLLYPNPANTKVSIQGKGYNSDKLQIVVRNSMGQIVFMESYSLTNEVFVTEINIESWMPGVYLVEVEQTGSPSEKIMMVKY